MTDEPGLLVEEVRCIRILEMVENTANEEGQVGCNGITRGLGV